MTRITTTSAAALNWEGNKGEMGRKGEGEGEGILAITTGHATSEILSFVGAITHMVSR